MNEIEKICKEIQCPHFIVWNSGYGDCISCKLQGENYNIESIADDCPYKDRYGQRYANTGCCYLPKGSIKKLIGRDLYWSDEPVELKEE